MILIDTDVCVEILKGNNRILQKRAEYDGPIGICFMTIAELFYGAEKSRNIGKNLEAIEKLLLTVEILHTDLSILKRFGVLKALLENDGRPLADADVLIASVALEKTQMLITGNRKHFERIPGLVIDDWITSA